VSVGIFGGTFDPPHLGHLIVAQDAWAALSLERLRFMPAAVPPHKTAVVMTPAAVRRELLAAAIGEDARFEVDDVELRREGPSYTVDTLRALRARAPAEELVLLIGADQYAEFSTWREPSAILELARVVVLTRDGAAASRRGDGVEWLAVTRIDISSTEIRRRVAAGEPIRYLVPEAVERKIRERALYGASPVTAGAAPRA
jgi:nicotinate-nucleotide adenylyltransferase